MASPELNEVHNSGQSTFGSIWGSVFHPTGKIGRFWSKVFATKAQPYVGNDEEPPDPETYQPHPLAGDTVVRDEVIKAEGEQNPNSFQKRGGRVPVLPEQESVRRRRYKEYEEMDEYPEISSAFDIYADDATQKDLKGNRFIVHTDNRLIKEEVSRLFKVIKLDSQLWDIARSTVKFGDCFIEIVIDLNNPKAGVQRIKVLNPTYILRVENEYGYLTDFLQELPSQNDWEAFGAISQEMSTRKFIELDKNQIVHFRLYSTDVGYYPYGKSVAAGTRSTFRSLKMMEDAMLIYRLQRAPERRVFYIDVGQMPSSKAEMYIERIKQKFKKEKYYDTSRNTINERYNPLSADEDFFVPIKGKSQGTKVETLPGAQNLGDIDDVKYFRDKILASMKVPKDYIVEKDKSPERKSNLSQLDVKFARTITRVQQNIETGLEEIAKRHLLIKGFPPLEVASMSISLSEPGDMFLKRKLDIEDQRTAVVSQVQNLGLFSNQTILEDFYELNEDEIEEEKKKLLAEMDDPVYSAQGMMEEEGLEGIPGEEGDIGQAQQGGEIQGSNTQGLEPQENKTPTSEDKINTLNSIKSNLLLKEGKEEIIELLDKKINKLRTASLNESTI